MKLTHVLKGHVNDRCVKVTNGFEQIEWNGAGIKSMIIRTPYYTDWLEREVITVSKNTSGKTVIVVRLAGESENV